MSKTTLLLVFGILAFIVIGVLSIKKLFSNAEKEELIQKQKLNAFWTNEKREQYFRDKEKYYPYHR